LEWKALTNKRADVRLVMLSRIKTYGGLHTTLLQLEPEATRRPLLRDVDIVAYKHSFFGKNIES